MIQPDKIIRSNRKTLAVCISPFGEVTVRAPKTCDTARIFAFLEAKEKWILRQKAKTAGAGMRLPPENLHGFTFLLLGRDCRILLHGGRDIRFDRDTGSLYLPERNARARLQKWLKENALRIFTEATENAAKRMGVSYKSVRVTSAKTRWGSCSGENAVRYSFRLLYAPKEVIEYVVVHELAHTKQKNHSPKFWREVEKFDPAWRQKRAWLKTHAYLMEIF